MQDEDQDPWAELSDEEFAAMRALTPADVSQVDALLLSACSTNWQKVARVPEIRLHQPAPRDSE
jgi:hypothetical protein